MIEMVESDAGTRRRFLAREAFDDDLDLLEDIRRRKSTLEGDESVVVARLSRRARGMTLGLDADESAVCGFARTDEEKRLLVAEVGAAVRVPEGTVGAMVSDAETLATSLPSTLAALQAGEITGRHAHVMVAQCSTVPVESHAVFEAALLPAAGRLTVAQFTQRARVYRERVHPETPRKRHVEAVERRGVWVDPAADGMAQLSVLMPAADALAIDDKLDQIARSQRGEGESRTHAQRRCDAAIALLLDPEGDLARVAQRIRPQVILTVPALSLLGHTEEPAELNGYGPIDAVTARRLTADAPSVTRWLTDPVTGRVLDVGRENYRIPAELRLALTIEDETCRFPGCRRRAQRCELDHVHAWADGGGTDCGNLANLCSKHHHLKHESDWTVEALSGRQLRWTSPIGRVHTTEPANPALPPWPENPARPESSPAEGEPPPALPERPPADLESPPRRPGFRPVSETNCPFEEVLF